MSYVRPQPLDSESEVRIEEPRTVVWDPMMKLWFELDDAALDALADFGAAVASGEVAEDEALQAVIQGCRAARRGVTMRK